MQYSSLDARVFCSVEDVTLRGNRSRRAYEIKNVPPGKYTLTAWQEHMGTQTQEVTVSGGAATANFTFKALPY